MSLCQQTLGRKTWLPRLYQPRILRCNHSELFGSLRIEISFILSHERNKTTGAVQRRDRYHYLDNQSGARTESNAVSRKTQMISDKKRGRIFSLFHAACMESGVSRDIGYSSWPCSPVWWDQLLHRNRYISTRQKSVQSHRTFPRTCGLYI
jgi:hypothetical protein